MILVDGKNHLKYVLDDTFSIIDDLYEQIHELSKNKPFLKGSYIDELTNSTVTYEVIKYEGR
jgi:hypothetical protein